MISNHTNSVLEKEQQANPLFENNNLVSITDEEIFFAKERYNLHQSSPEEGVETDILKKYFFKKYGF